MTKLLNHFILVIKTQALLVQHFNSSAISVDFSLKHSLTDVLCLVMNTNRRPIIGRRYNTKCCY